MLQVSTHNGSGISGSTELTLDYGVYDLTLPTTRDGASFRGQQTLAKYLPTKRRAPQVDVEVTDAGGRPPTKAKAAQFPASPPKSATEVVALLPKAPAKAKAAEVPAAPPANAKSTQEVQAPPETASLAPAPSGQTLVGPPPKSSGYSCRGCGCRGCGSQEESAGQGKGASSKGSPAKVSADGIWFVSIQDASF